MILICSVQNEFLLIKVMEERQFYTVTLDKLYDIDKV